MARSPVSWALSCPQYKLSVHLQALPFWEQDMKMGCLNYSSARISIVQQFFFTSCSQQTENQAGTSESCTFLLHLQLNCPHFQELLCITGLFASGVHTAGPSPQQAAAVTQTSGNPSRKTYIFFSLGAGKEHVSQRALAPDPHWCGGMI